MLSASGAGWQSLFYARDQVAEDPAPATTEGLRQSPARAFAAGAPGDYPAKRAGWEEILQWAIHWPPQAVI